MVLNSSVQRISIVVANLFFACVANAQMKIDADSEVVRKITGKSYIDDLSVNDADLTLAMRSSGGTPCGH